MRLAPVPLFFAAEPAAAMARAADSSRTTHGALTCVDACRYMAGLIVGAVNGVPKETLLAPGYAPQSGAWTEAPLCPEIAAVAGGSFQRKQPPAIRGTGYVVDALEAALWAFAHHDDFRSGALAAVNLGDDADTTGAIFGQIAGAHYGAAAIPQGWRERIAMADVMLGLADGLYARAVGLGASG
jgi:ADP-ribosylglycohydrolase